MLVDRRILVTVQHKQGVDKMQKWSKALHTKTGDREVFLFVSGKAFKIVVMTTDGAIATLYRNKEKALAHYESII
jgi:hypothetical protein